MNAEVHLEAPDTHLFYVFWPLWGPDFLFKKFTPATLSVRLHPLSPTPLT